LTLLIVSAGAVSADDLTLDWWTVDGGGGVIVGDDFELSATIGQADAAEMAGDDFTLTAGYWFAAAPELIHVEGDVGPHPWAYVSPMSKHAACDSVVILVSEPVTLLDACTTSTGAQPAPDVTGMTPLEGAGAYRVDLTGPIEVGAWTTIALTVESATAARSVLCFQLGHLPGDCNQDGQLSMADADGFRFEWVGDKRPRLGDLNGDGQMNLNDATALGQIWHGTSGEGTEPDGTGGWNGEGLPTPRPPCACGEEGT